ncbi:hypothetical protein [Pantoea sp. SGAir0418]
MKVDTATDTCMKAKTEKRRLVTGGYVHTTAYNKMDTFAHDKGDIIFADYP